MTYIYLSTDFSGAIIQEWGQTVKLNLHILTIGLFLHWPCRQHCSTVSLRAFALVTRPLQPTMGAITTPCMLETRLSTRVNTVLFNVSD
jgi:hypothetical protein